MEQSAAISPEIVELFNKVRSQAKEYEDAFVSIRNQKLQLDLLKNTLDEFSRTKAEQIEILINEFTNSVSIALESIENKNNEVLQLFSELSEVKKLKENLAEYLALLNKSKKEFDVIINSAPDSIKETAEAEIDRISRKVITNIRQFDGKLLNIDEKIASLIAIERRDIQNLTDEVQNIKSRSNVSRSIDNRNQKQSDKAIDIINEDISPKIEKIDGIVKKLKESFEKEFSSFANTDDMKKNFNDLFRMNKELKDKITALESRPNSSLLSIVAIILAVIFGILGIVIK